MHALLRTAGWAGLAAAVVTAAAGALSTRIPASGLVVGLPLAGLALRESLAAPWTLAQALLGRLEVERWPEAARYAADVHRFGVLVAWAFAALGAAQIPWLPTEAWLAAAATAASPPLLAYALGWLLWEPLRASLAKGYAAWLAGLREALASPDPQAAPPVIPEEYLALLRRVA